MQEVRSGRLVAVTGEELLSAINAAREFLRNAGLKKGDRCALLAHNSIRWVALDLAVMAEGGMVVPLYARQSPSELVEMMKDCEPSLICCGDEALRNAVIEHWPEAPSTFIFEEIFAAAVVSPDDSQAGPTGNPDAIHHDVSGIGERPDDTPQPLAEGDPITIIYTSGTSGEAKGVILGAGNLNYMLRCTGGRLDSLMGSKEGSKIGASEAPDRVFHYLPFCFCGSWVLLLTCLSRNSVLTISTDLNQLVEEMRLAAPDYFLNVPALLERMRAGIEGQFNQWGGVRKKVFEKGKDAWFERRAGTATLFDHLWVTLAGALIFPAIKKKISPNLKALICGSAPLALETQLFFTMIGLPVLQVYGLTETTAICTMDRPYRVDPGRVGPAIEGIEMRRGPGDEILVRGPNLFLGYWNRPRATMDAMRDGWFHTGDQGEADASGNWSITGRIKNLIVLGSGHNVAPEPIEEMLLRQLSGAQQVLVVGNGRSFLSAIVTGSVTNVQVEKALEILNPQLPHYRRVRAFHLHGEPFTVDNGMLTANGKLKREIIAERFQEKIEELYRDRVTSEPRP